jgi:hypothetical protein
VDLAIFDGRIEVGNALAAQARAAGIAAIDVTADREAFWNLARKGFDFTRRKSIVGVTRWDDWVTLRASLAERRMRVLREIRLDCSGEDGDCAAHELLPALTSGGGSDRRSITGARGTAFAWLLA